MEVNQFEIFLYITSFFNLHEKVMSGSAPALEWSNYLPDRKLHRML